jgi:hypothetical protein
VLEGWKVPREGLWRIPLVKNVVHVDEDTIITKKSSTKILRENPPPPIEHVLSVYELKTRLELIAYYHAATGFPTRPTWVKAIKNGHYESWPGLTATAAAKYFPESVETWQGHGRKIQSNLRSTKVALKEEGWQLKGAPYHTTYNTLFGDKTKGATEGTAALIHKIEDDVDEPANAPAKCGMKQGDDDVTLDNPNPPLTIFHKVYDLHDNMQRKMYTDQTGKFPFKLYPL